MLSVRLIRPSYLINTWCFWGGRSFVRPLTIIYPVGRYEILISPRLTSCLSQHWATLMCRSLVEVFSSSDFRILMVWVLSPCRTTGYSSLRLMLRNRFFHHIIYFAAWSIPSSSTLVDKVITVNYFLTAQFTIPPKSLNVYSSPDRHLGPVVYDISDVASKTCVDVPGTLTVNSSPPEVLN